MNYPEEVIDAVDEAVRANPCDIDAGIDELDKAIRALPSFPQFVDALVRRAERELFNDRRHEINKRIKKQAGGYGGPGKVNGASPAVNSVYESVYGYYIGTKVLGEILGADLAGIAARENETAAGHAFNARLCRRLMGLVPQDKRVRDAVKERCLRSLFKEVDREVKAEFQPAPPLEVASAAGH